MKRTDETRKTQALIELLLEACGYLQEHAGFKHGTGLDGAFLDRVAEELGDYGVHDVAWLRRVERHYGKERVRSLLSRAGAP